MPQLDGLRAFAVSSVMVGHWIEAYPLGLPAGSIGVLLFFVISGFLISGNLLDAWSPGDNRNPRRTVVKNFYARRFLRIFPLYYAALAVAALLDIPPVRETLGVTLTYLTNFHLFLHNDWHGAISHLWSLAVEEQFYLFWPVLLLFLPRRFLLPTIVALALSAPLFRVAIAAVAPSHHPHLISILPPSCCDALGIGALLAFLLRHPPHGFSVFRLARWLLAMGTAGFIVVWTCRWASIQPRLMESLYPTFLSLIFGWLVLNRMGPASDAFGKVLSLSWLRYFGQISYGIYVLHYFAPWIVVRLEAKLSLLHPQLTAIIATPAMHILLLTVVTFAGAVTSWHLFEKPLNDLKRFFPQHPTSA